MQRRVGGGEVRRHGLVGSVRARMAGTHASGCSPPAGRRLPPQLPLSPILPHHPPAFVSWPTQNSCQRGGGGGGGGAAQTTT